MLLVNTQPYSPFVPMTQERLTRPPRFVPVQHASGFNLTLDVPHTADGIGRFVDILEFTLPYEVALTEAVLHAGGGFVSATIVVTGPKAVVQRLSRDADSHILFNRSRESFRATEARRTRRLSFIASNEQQLIDVASKISRRDFNMTSLHAYRCEMPHTTGILRTDIEVEVTESESCRYEEMFQELQWSDEVVDPLRPQSFFATTFDSFTERMQIGRL